MTGKPSRINFAPKGVVQDIRVLGDRKQSTNSLKLVRQCLDIVCFLHRLFRGKSRFEYVFLLQELSSE